MLAHAAGEDQAVHAAERGCHGADPLDRSIDEEVDGGLGVLSVGGHQFAQIAAQARDAEQAGPPVEQVLDLARAHLVTLEQMEDDAGIQAAAPGGHHQAVERAEAHRRVLARLVLQRAKARARAQVGGHEAAGGEVRIDGAQPAQGVGVGQAVEPVAANTLRGEVARQGEAPRGLGHAAVEGGVEAGDVGRGGQARPRLAVERQSDRLMQGRKRRQGLQLGLEVRREDRRRGVIAAMHDAVRDDRDWLALGLAVQPGKDARQG